MASTEIQKEILKHATDLFFRYGIKSVSIDDICREMAMSKKTFYQHYATKDELVDALLDDSVEKMDNHLGAYLEGRRLDEMLQHFVNYQKTSKDDVRRVPTLVYDLQKYYPAPFNRFQQRIFESQKKHLTAVFERGKQEGYVRQNLDVEMTAVFFAKVHSDAVRDLDRIRAYGIDAVQLSKLAMEILVRGVLSDKGLELVNK